MSHDPAAETSPPVRLTSLSSCAGCASKLSQATLGKVLRDLPQFDDPRLLVGNATSDDAGVFVLDAERALVQTTDFFTPIVDDPFTYGQVAATNALSDVFAMGGRPITALALVAMPVEVLNAATIREILRGGAKKAEEARCVVLGGHTIKAPEPIYGLACTGLVHPERFMTNANARPGDLLVLTKPLGTGIVTTAIKRGLADPSVVAKTVELMTTLNTIGADLAEKGFCRAATDMTGFGLLGHLRSMCRASSVVAEIEAEAVPALDPAVLDLVETHACVPGGTKENMRVSEPEVAWADSVKAARRVLLADAQTSGGLLCAVPEKHLADVLDLLGATPTLSRAIIGRLIPPTEADGPLVSVH